MSTGRSITSSGGARGRRMVVLAALAGTVGASVAPVMAGPLDPPPGPPMPTMKRLDQIEPRRCLNDLVSTDTAATALVSITEPGRYYLTADLVCPTGKSAVVISTPGSVEIDLNGFSIRGLVGAIDGIRDAGASRDLAADPSARLLITGGAGGMIFGFSGRAISTGSVAGDGYAQVIVSDLAIVGCARGIEHLKSRGVIHRDLAARSCPQGGISIFGADAPAAGTPGGGRNSISMSRIELSDCGGPASVRVVLPGGGRISVDMAAVARSTGDGISVSYPNPAALTSASGNSASFRRCTCPDGGLYAIRVAGPQSSREVPVSVEALTVHGAGGGALSLENVGTVEVDGLNAYRNGDDPITHRLVGALKYKNIVLKRCAGGFHAEDCDDLEIRGFTASETTGRAAWIVRGQRVSISGSIDGVAGGATGAGGEGLVLDDCASVGSSDLSVSRCSGHAILHTFSNTSAGASASIAHWGTRAERCGGAGVVVINSRTGLGDLEVRLANFGLLSCAAGGLIVDCAGAGPNARVGVRCQDGSCRGSTAGSGAGLICGDTSHFRVDMSGVSLTGNSGDGLAVVNAAAPGTAIAGQTTLNDCDLSNNGGSGCVTDNPLYAGSTTMGSNVLHGARCVAPDGFTLAASMDGCTIARNGSDGVRVSRGRYANADCQISDNGGTGIVVADGCLLMTNSMVHRSGGDGVSVVGTLTVHGGALRRNAGAGARSSGGPVSLEACAVELNGAGSATVAAGSGGLALSDCASVRVSRCSLSENTGAGMRHLRAQATFSDMTSIDVTECTAGHNTGPGILLDGFVGGSVSSCVAAGNAGGALSLGTNSSRCRVGGNTFSAPAGQGDALVRVFGSAHLVVGNSLSGGGAGVPPIVGGQGSTVGQVVSGADVSTRCSPSDNIVH